MRIEGSNLGKISLYEPKPNQQVITYSLRNTPAPTSLIPSQSERKLFTFIFREQLLSVKKDFQDKQINLLIWSTAWILSYPQRRRQLVQDASKSDLEPVQIQGINQDTVNAFVSFCVSRRGIPINNIIYLEMLADRALSDATQDVSSKIHAINDLLKHLTKPEEE